MQNLLSVNFSTGLAAVLLGAAAIILIVMIAEAISMSRPRKVKNKEAKPTCAECAPAAVKEAAKAEPPRNEEPPRAVQPPQEIPSGTADEEPVPAAVEPEEKPQAEEQTAKPEKPRVRKTSVKTKGGKTTRDKSFTARLILSDGDVKERYSHLKNELLKRGFQSRICWRYESFRAVKKLAARLAIRGGCTGIFCALNPDNYLNYDGKVEDLSDKKAYKNTPLLCTVKSSGDEEISKQLIADLAQKYGVENTEFEECDFAALLPFEDEQTLIEKGLIKVKIRPKKIKQKKIKKEEKSGVKIPLKTTSGKREKKVEKSVKKRAKKGVKKAVNLDVVFKNFNEGETATFEEIKKRIFGNKKNITYIKILGGGKADKNITVIANSFSRTAEKNILEAGGKAIRKNR